MDISIGNVTFILFILALVFVFKTINVVPQQHAWVVERLGKYHATLGPGLNIVIPFVDRIAYKHVLKEIPLDVPPQVCITRDNTQLQVDGILYFQITDAMRASYGSSNYIAAITQLAQTTLRSVIGRMELDKTFEEREHINTAIVNAIDESAANWGVKVLRYEIKDLTPPKEIEGRSLVPLLKNPKAEWNHPAFTVWSEDGKTYHGVAVRNERWRYAEFGPDGKNGAMLFDQQADPQELKNLADDSKFADVRKELSALVRDYARNVVPPSAPANPARVP